MIGFLRGNIEAKSPNAVLLDVEGVGYHVTIPVSAYNDLPEVGAEMKMFTHLHMRENALELYGFLTIEDRSLFLQLLSVTDVGPKTAMNVLSGIGSEAFRSAIVNQDLPALTNVPGVGKKTAGRLMLELKDKMGEAMVYRNARNGMASDVYDDATAALVSLGYTSQMVREAMRKAYDGFKKDMSVQDVIKQTLRYL